MKIFRLVTIALMLSGSSMLLLADIEEPPPPLPGHFMITGAGWILPPIPNGPIQKFHGETNTGMTVGENGFTRSCFPPDSSLCDPTMDIDLGGLSQSVNGSFDFTADPNGTGTVDFHAVNVGAPIKDILVTTVLDPMQFKEGFACDGTAFFECGFKVIGTELDILWDNPDGTPAIGTGVADVPEPAAWMLLLTAGVTVLARRTFASRSRQRIG